MSERWYLAYRNKDGLRKIEVFERNEGDRALREYEALEQRCASYNESPLGIGGEHDCCLFGSDSLATLCRTHASWFDPDGLGQVLHDLLPNSENAPDSAP